MRMWNVNPKYLCTNHLLGEHLEMHMFIGCIKLNKSVKGYIDKGLVEIHNIVNRHNDLVIEMILRGMSHNSNLYYDNLWVEGNVNTNENIEILKERCIKCRKLIISQL